MQASPTARLQSEPACAISIAPSSTQTCCSMMGAASLEEDLGACRKIDLDDPHRRSRPAAPPRPDIAALRILPDGCSAAAPGAPRRSRTNSADRLMPSPAQSLSRTTALACTSPRSMREINGAADTGT